MCPCVSNWNFEELVFEERGKLENRGVKPLGARERANDKLNPNMASAPGFNPGPHWGEASALTTGTMSITNFLRFRHKN